MFQISDCRSTSLHTVNQSSITRSLAIEHMKQIQCAAPPPPPPHLHSTSQSNHKRAFLKLPKIVDISSIVSSLPIPVLQPERIRYALRAQRTHLPLRRQAAGETLFRPKQKQLPSALAACSTAVPFRRRAKQSSFRFPVCLFRAVARIPSNRSRHLPFDLAPRVACIFRQSQANTSCQKSATGCGVRIWKRG